MNKPDKQNSKIKRKSIAIVVCCAVPFIAILILGKGLGNLLGRATQSTSSTVISGLNSSDLAANTIEYPAGKWQTDNHTHGLSVSSTNPNLIYLATHHGLLQHTQTGKWLWLEPTQKRADYMGFTADPTNPQRFYTSGHPQTGGNLGFQVTENSAQDWKQISMPGVDFHALAIAPNNPKVFYGFPASGAEGLHASTDGGKTWQKTQMNGLKAAPFNLVVDPVNADQVFAITPAGLYESTDRGNVWSLVSNTQKTPVIGLALQQEAGKTVMYSSRPAQSGIDRSMDGGKTWQKWGTGTKGMVMYLAIAPSNPKMFYAINRENTVFQSQDGGRNWKELI